MNASSFTEQIETRRRDGIRRQTIFSQTTGCYLREISWLIVSVRKLPATDDTMLKLTLPSFNFAKLKLVYTRKHDFR